MSYNFRYMSLRARGEPVRWILKVLGVEYTEEGIDIFREWVARKSEFKFGKVPVLEVNGEQLHQTIVISRFLGEKHNLSSSDLWTISRQMEVVEAIHDLTNYMASALHSRLIKNEERMKELLARTAKQFPVVLANIEERITDQGWILSDEMTWADVFVAAYLDTYDNYFPGVVSKFPKSQGLRDRVQELPAIKEWRRERPGFHPFEDPQGIAMTDGGDS